MDIKRNGTQPSSPGPAEYFTGRVRIDPLFESPSDEDYSAAVAKAE
jgi:hypothetical protein